MSSRCIWFAGVCVAGAVGVAATPSTALAQEVGATGTVTTQTTTQVQAPAVATPAPTSTQSATSSSTYAAASGNVSIPDDATPDHDKVVGHFAVGYMGVSQVPLRTTGNLVPAPVIGGRYWITRGLGIDAGLGLALFGGSNEVAGVSTDKASIFGMIFHAGVPLALAVGRHFAFEVIPEANVGFTSQTVKAPNVPDVSNSGTRIEIGARAGGEIQFGFIGLPQLALQGSIGLYFTRLSGSSTANGVSAIDTTTVLGTSVKADPWALFTNNVSALYYF